MLLKFCIKIKSQSISFHDVLFLLPVRALCLGGENAHVSHHTSKIQPQKLTTEIGTPTINPQTNQLNTLGLIKYERVKDQINRSEIGQIILCSAKLFYDLKVFLCLTATTLWEFDQLVKPP